MGFKVKVPNLNMLHFFIKVRLVPNNIATIEYNKDRELKFGTMGQSNNLNLIVMIFKILNRRVSQNEA